MNPSYFVIIPTFILDDPDIDQGTAILFGRISSLTNKEGYCFASDKYLAKLTKESERMLRYRLKTLEDKGYIRRETTKKGILWERKIFSNYNYERNTIAARTATHCLSNGNPLPSIKDKIEQDKKENNTYAPPKGDAPTSSKSKQKPKKTERAPKVETTDDEHDKLIEKYGSDVVEKCYQELALWKESASAAQVKKHTSDYLRITKWVALSVMDQSQKEKKLMNPDPVKDKGSRIEKNRDYALKKLSGGDPNIARCQEHFVQITIQGRRHQLFYDAHGFEEQLRNAMEKAFPNTLAKLTQGVT